MVFSRPVKNNGKYDWSNLPQNTSAFPGYPVLSFAMGRAGHSCDDFSFGYHHGLRGTRGWSFSDPASVFPDAVKC